jgi:uncharacterized protein YjbI with pentapeptide repeats
MLNKSDFSEAIAPGLTIISSIGISAKFNGADLTGAHLENSGLSLGDFRKAKLSGAVLRKSRFHEANFGSCDLSGADLAEAELYQANLASAIIRDAKFTGAKYDRKTKWGKAGAPAGAVLVKDKDK